MSRRERKALCAELHERVEAGLDAGLPLEEIQHQPDTQKLLFLLYPGQDMIEQGHRAVIRRQVQMITNEKGERQWVYYENMRIPFDPEPALLAEDFQPDAPPDAGFFPVQKVAETRTLRNGALLKLRNAMRGLVRKAGGYVESDAVVEILTVVDEVFARLIARA